MNNINELINIYNQMIEENSKLESIMILKHKYKETIIMFSPYLTSENKEQCKKMGIDFSL